MASKPGRKLGNWRGPAEGRLMLCVLNMLMRQRRDRAFVVGEFKRLVPDYQTFHRSPISDDAIWGRADVGVRGGKYEREHPDKAPDIARYMPAALVIVAAGVPMSEREIRDVVEHVDEGEPPTAPAAPPAEAPWEPVADPPPFVGFPEPAPPQPVAPVPARPAVCRRPSIRNRTIREMASRRDPALDDPDIVSRLRRYGYDGLADEIEAGGEPVLPCMPDEEDEEDEAVTEAPEPVPMAAE